MKDDDNTGALLEDAVDRMLARLAAGAGDEGRAGLWKAVEDSGYVDLLRGAAKGGGDASPEEFSRVAYVAGRHALALPFVHTIVARHVLDLAGIEAPSGELALVFDLPAARIEAAGGKAHVDALWASEGGQVVVVSPLGEGAAVRLSTFTGKVFATIADEPEGRLSLSDLTGEAVAIDPALADRCWRLMALGQAGMISGALDRVFEMSLQYVSDRAIFGKKMKSFQVVQHNAAQMAEEICAGGIITRVAARDFDTDRGPLLLAAARARLADAVEVVASAAHQFHGAIGFTLDYPLQRWTKRLWAWRDQYGAAAIWRAAVGRAFVGLEADDLWPMLSGTRPDPEPARI